MGLIATLSALVAVLVCAPALGQEPIKPASRAEAITIIANAHKIATPNGVELLQNVRIGGIDQWVSIRVVSKNSI